MPSIEVLQRHIPIEITGPDVDHAAVAEWAAQGVEDLQRRALASVYMPESRSILSPRTYGSNELQLSLGRLMHDRLASTPSRDDKTKQFRLQLAVVLSDNLNGKDTEVTAEKLELPTWSVNNNRRILYEQFSKMHPRFRQLVRLVIPGWAEPAQPKRELPIVDWGDWHNAPTPCKSAQPDEFFVRGAEQNRVKEGCQGCPVRTECLTEALANQIEWGVWGGLTERERRAILRRGWKAPEVA